MIYDRQREQIVIYGGQDNNVGLAEAWTWDGKGWTYFQFSGSSPALYNAPLIYDPASEQAISFMGGNRMGPGVSSEFRQFVFDFRARWASVVEAAGDPFDSKSLSAKDQEDIGQLSFPGEMLAFVLAWSTAMLDWGTVTPADIRCPTLWLIGSEYDKAMESLNQYKEEIAASKVQVQIIDGLNHLQEFDDIEQVLPVSLSFIKQEK